MWQVAKVGIVCLALCVVAAAPACAQETRPAAPGKASVAPPASAGQPARPDHVVIVVLENKDEQDVAREAPYLTALAGSGASLTDMHAETHPSQPNYLALFSGGTQGVHDDNCPLMFDVPSLAGELVAAGYSFAGYAEDLPGAGYTGCHDGDYARKHSPWTDFRDVPASADQPLSAMPDDYADLPTVSLLIPITERADHYRLLRTLEDFYGLPPLGHSAQVVAISGVWRGGSS
jgi:phosphatidylinositol-3-phosphatase